MMSMHPAVSLSKSACDCGPLTYGLMTALLDENLIAITCNDSYQYNTIQVFYFNAQKFFYCISATALTKNEEIFIGEM